VWGAGSGGRGGAPAALTCGELYRSRSSFSSAVCRYPTWKNVMNWYYYSNNFEYK
jgi:hypothetical protein